MLKWLIAIAITITIVIAGLNLFPGLFATIKTFAFTSGSAVLDSTQTIYPYLLLGIIGYAVYKVFSKKEGK
jgi:hypothetical protein